MDAGRFQERSCRCRLSRVWWNTMRSEADTTLGKLAVLNRLSGRAARYRGEFSSLNDGAAAVLVVSAQYARPTASNPGA